MLTPDEILDRAVERNARLIVLLNQVMPTFHRLGIGHHPGPWRQCSHLTCRKVALTLNGQYGEADQIVYRHLRRVD